MGDAGRRRRRALHGDRHRIAQDLPGERHDRRRDRRREAERLTARREPLQDAADVGQEAHVEHAVRLVEHQHLEAGEASVGLPEMVEQAAGRGDEDVDAATERLLLRAIADAAEDRRAREPRVTSELLPVLVDLRRQLARRGEDEGARGSARASEEALQDRQQERRRSCRSRSSRTRGRPGPRARAGWRRAGSGSASRSRGRRRRAGGRGGGRTLLNDMVRGSSRGTPGPKSVFRDDSIASHRAEEEAGIARSEKDAGSQVNRRSEPDGHQYARDRVRRCTDIFNRPDAPGRGRFRRETTNGAGAGAHCAAGCARGSAGGRPAPASGRGLAASRDSW